MTIILDDVSEPGAWAQHLRDTQCMRHCSRCGVGGWHPETKSCQFNDCELRAMPAQEVGAESSPLGSAPAVVPPVHFTSVADAGARNHA